MNGDGSSAQFVALVETWRTSLGLNHRRFVALLGRDEVEWSHYRAGRREPSDTFVRAVLAKAPGAWRTALEAAYAADAVARLAAPAPATAARPGAGTAV